MFSHLDETQQCVPRLYRKRSFCEDVGQLIFGVDIFYTDNWIFDEAFEEPTEVNPMCSTYMPHKDTPTLNCHFNDCFIVLQNY